jgi:multidrug resistance efflux pump
MQTQPHKRRRIIIIATTAVCGIALIIGINSCRSPKVLSEGNSTLNEQYVLAPTSGIIRRIIITAGESVPAKAPLLRISQPAYEQRVQTAREAVSRVRLELNEERLIVSAQKGTQEADASIARLRHRIQSEQDTRAINAKTQQVSELTRNVTSRQAMLARIQANPLKEGRTQSDISDLDAQLVTVQAQRDVAISDLKLLKSQTSTQIGKGSEAAITPQNSSDSDRGMQTAVEMLANRERELEEILKEELENGVDVLAPFAGQVIGTHQHEGIFVRKGQPLLTLIPSLDSATH